MPRHARKIVDRTVLEMALVGYQAERAKIRAAIETIQAQLGKRGPGRPKGSVKAAQPASAAKPKRTLSAAARKRISEAAKKRWARRKAAAA